MKFLAAILAVFLPLSAFSQGPVIRNPVTTNQFMNAPQDGWIAIWNNIAQKWSNGVNVASSTNLPAYLQTSTLTNLAGTGLSSAATNSSSVLPNIIGTGATTNINEGNILYVRTNGNDATAVRGRLDKPWLTVTSAVANLVAGDHLKIGPGTFDIGTNAISLPKTGVKMSGAGAETTTLLWKGQLTTNGPGIVFVDNAVFEDFAVQCAYTNSIYQAAFGSKHNATNSTTAFTNLVTRRLRGYGDTDSLYIWATNKCIWVDYDSRFISKWDAGVILDQGETGSTFNQSDIHLWHTLFYSDLKGSINPASAAAALSKGLTVAAGRVTLHGCTCIATNADSVYAASFTISGSGGQLFIYGGFFDAAGTNNAFAIYSATASTNVIASLDSFDPNNITLESPGKFTIFPRAIISSNIIVDPSSGLLIEDRELFNTWSVYLGGDGGMRIGSTGDPGRDNLVVGGNVSIQGINTNGILYTGAGGIIRTAALSGLTLSGGTLTATGSGTPGGANGDLQFNESGSFAGTNEFRTVRGSGAYLQVSNTSPVSGYTRLNGGSLIRRDSGSPGLAFGVNSATNWQIDTSGNWVPNGNNYTIGTTASPVGGIYTTNLINFLLGNTNIPIISGILKSSFYQSTNGNNIVNFALTVPESGCTVLLMHTNSAATNYTVTFFTNSVAASFFSIADQTNATSWTVPAGAIVSQRLVFNGTTWLRMDVETSLLTLAAGGIIKFMTNGQTLTITNTSSTGSGDIVQASGGNLINPNITNGQFWGSAQNIYEPQSYIAASGITGTGGALTNFTFVAVGTGSRVISYVDAGTTNVNIVAIMGGTVGVVQRNTLIFTNRTATSRTVSLSAQTNNWISLQKYDGITAPFTITNGMAGRLEYELNGTNVFYAFKPHDLPTN